MDRPRDYHTKWSKSDKDKYMIHLYVESKQMIQMNLFTKQKHILRHRKKNIVTKGDKSMEKGIN